MISEEYKKYILDLNLGELKNKKRALSSRLKTTDLMTDLRIGNKYCNYSIGNRDPFDVLYLNVFARRTHNLLYTLVVIYGIPDKVIETIQEFNEGSNKEYTFTELKKIRNPDYLFYGLDSIQIRINENNLLNLWDVPVVLKATTNFDKDFGDRYFGETLVHMGNKYGDTSKFYIIGIIKNKI